MLFNKERTRVLATANTDANGFYKLKSRIALQPGRYDLRLRAISSDGVTSQWSQPVSFVVVA
jgi:methionine-rich copper-binding protein CopC